MRKLNVILLISLFLYGTTLADEGMWIPSLIHKLNIAEMQEMGCELSAEDIYNINESSLKDAIVALDKGSCTAEVVSKDGLLLTNHHCAFDEIQSHSSVDHDYLRDGFWAMSRDEELPNPDLTVTFLIRIEDVTDKVLEGINEQMSETERKNAVSSNSGKLEADARGSSHYETIVKSFYNSNRYYLFVTETFRDVRLVGAPPQALGKFGGDTDNWMWPRHTNDFALFRIYTGPDGKPASYSEDNIPYQAKQVLPISLKGVKEGDFAMIMGYPGTTYRYKTSFGVKYTMDVTNTVREEVRKKLLNVWGDYMSTGPKARIQYAAKYAKSSNYYKYSIGQNKGLTDLNIIDEKEKLEKEFTQWVNSDETRIKKYGKALSYIEESYRYPEDDKAMYYMSEALLRGAEIFKEANNANLLLTLLKKTERNQNRINRIAGYLKRSYDDHFKNYNAETEKRVVASMLKVYRDNTLPEFHPPFLKEIQKKYNGDYMKYTSKMFKKSVFDDQQELYEFLDDPSLKILEKDMVFQATIEIYDKYREIIEHNEEEQKNLEKGQRLYMAGLMEMKSEKIFYPDANSTMRLTYGQVKDYEPRDGVTYNYFTTAEGYLEKEIPGDPEFNIPDRMKELLVAREFGDYSDKEGNLRTCFITNNDITGGNSGSPVLNANGEIIGIAFDGNWEAMSGDIAFEPDLQRCINVDIRFVLWMIDVYAGADHLINEMQIIR